MKTKTKKQKAKQKNQQKKSKKQKQTYNIKHVKTEKPYLFKTFSLIIASIFSHTDLEPIFPVQNLHQSNSEILSSTRRDTGAAQKTYAWIFNEGWY